jgi:hypothetical protein
MGVALLSGARQDSGGEWPWGLLPLVAGLTLITVRNYIEIDTQTRQLSRCVGLVQVFPVRRFAFDVVKRIVLTLEKRRSRSKKGANSTRTVYVLRITAPDGEQLCEFPDLGHARLIAERICRAMDVDLQNRLMGGSSTRDAGELDLSLAERWRRAGVHHEAPLLPADTALTITHGEGFSELSWPVEPFPRATTAVGMVVVLSGLFALHHFADASLFMLLIFVPAVVFLGGGIIAQHSGRNRIRFTAGRISFHRGKLWRRHAALPAVEELLSCHEAYVLMSDGGYLTVDKPRGEEDCRVLRQFIERQIAQRQLNASTRTA